MIGTFIEAFDDRQFKAIKGIDNVPIVTDNNPRAHEHSLQPL